MTLNQLIDLFKAIGNAHYFIKYTEFGEVPDKIEANSESVSYPAFYQVPINSVNREQTIERTFTLVVCDLVYPGHENLNEILSDTEQTLSDIIKILRQESSDYTLIGDPQIVPFKDAFGDDTAGNYATVTIQTLNNSGYCDIPAIDFGYPGQSGTSGQSQDGQFKCSDLEACSSFTNLENEVITISTNITTIEDQINDLQTEIDNIAQPTISASQNISINQVSNDYEILLNDTIVDTNTIDSIHITLRELVDPNGTIVFSWDKNGNGLQLIDSFGTPSINWQVRNALTSVNGTSIDWENQYLYDYNGNTSLSWNNRILYTASGLSSVDWNNQVLIDTSNINSINWIARSLVDNTGSDVITWDTPSVGLQYVADFSSNYTNRSLVDKEYVDNAISNIPGVSYNFQNGISESLGIVKLGGNITNNTTIDLTGSGTNYNLGFYNGATPLIFIGTNGYFGNKFVGFGTTTQSGAEILNVNGLSIHNDIATYNSVGFNGGSGFSVMTAPGFKLTGAFAGGVNFSWGGVNFFDYAPSGFGDTWQIGNDIYRIGNGNIGIGTNSPTSILDIIGSTTSKASLRVRTGTMPTSPNIGDIYSDGIHLYCYLNNLWKQLDN